MRRLKILVLAIGVVGLLTNFGLDPALTGTAWFEQAMLASPVATCVPVVTPAHRTVLLPTQGETSVNFRVLFDQQELRPVGAEDKFTLQLVDPTSLQAAKLAPTLEPQEFPCPPKGAMGMLTFKLSSDTVPGTYAFGVVARQRLLCCPYSGQGVLRVTTERDAFDFAISTFFPNPLVLKTGESKEVTLKIEWLSGNPQSINFKTQTASDQVKVQLVHATGCATFPCFKQEETAELGFEIGASSDASEGLVQVTISAQAQTGVASPTTVTHQAVLQMRIVKSK